MIDRGVCIAFTLLTMAILGFAVQGPGSARIAVAEGRQIKSPLAALDGASPGEKVEVLQAVAGQKGSEALLTAASHTRSPHESVRRAAICALGKQSNIEAALYLLNAAHGSEQAEERLLALQQATRVVRSSDAEPRRRVDVYRSILLAAGRAEEKKLALSGLRNIRTVDALALVGEVLEEESIAGEAARAAVQMACPGKDEEGLTGPGVAPVLRRVTKVAGDSALKKEADSHLRAVAKKIMQEAEKYERQHMVPLIRGEKLEGWMGATEQFRVEDGKLVCLGGRDDLLTRKEYSDFALRFEFKLTPGANNGLGIRMPSPEEYGQSPAFIGTEIQILDNKADRYEGLNPYQYHGSIYGVAPAKRGFLKPAGRWNSQQVIAVGPWIAVKVNGTTILHANIDEAATPHTVDGRAHPGLDRERGHIAILGHGSRVEFRNIRIRDLSGCPSAGKPLNEPPAGSNALFNGRDLTGWKGLVRNPVSRDKVDPVELARAQKKANEGMQDHWKVEDHALVFDGKGHSLCTIREYENFELLVDWKIERGGDSGIYLRGSPQVQIWDPRDHPEGSGGLFNNKRHPGKPLKCADNPVGRWNTFRIKMVGEKVNVHLNDELVVDEVVMENYWDRSRPIFERGQIELQSHGSTLYFRNIFLRELP